MQTYCIIETVKRKLDNGVISHCNSEGNKET